MKPSFALSLSHEGIRLFSRAKGGWRLVGETSLDTPDLGETLSYLRDKATRLSGSGLTTKLILPSSQILYTSVTAAGPDDASRTTQIQAALAGMTPYGPEELAFDWREAGDLVRVAAVALETLQEAEAFAIEHRFNPISFVGDTQENDFDGEPFFGATEYSKTFIGDGEIVEADTEAFVITDKKKDKTFSGNLDQSVLLSPSAEAPPEQKNEPASEPENSSTEDEPDNVRLAGEIAEKTPAEDVELPEATTAASALPTLDEPAVKEELAIPEASEDNAEDDGGDISAFITSIKAKKTTIEVETPAIPEHLKKAKGTTSVPPAISGNEKPLSAHRETGPQDASFAHRPIVSGTPPAELAARLKATAKATQKSEENTDKTASGITGAAIGFASSLRKKSKDEQAEFATTREPQEEDVLEEPETDILPESKTEIVLEPLPDPIPPTPIISESADSTDGRSVEERLASANVTSSELELPDSDDLGASLGLEAFRASEADFKPAAPTEQDENVTVFGATKTNRRKTKPISTGLILLVGLIVIMGLVVLWSLLGDPKDPSEETSSGGTFESFNKELEVSPTTLPEVPVESAVVAVEDAPAVADVAPAVINLALDAPETAAPTLPVLASLGDTALPRIDEELQTADQSVDISEPESPEPLTLTQAQEAYDDSGIWQKSSVLETAPNIITTDSLYVPSLDPPLDISDAVALPVALTAPDDRPLPPQTSPAPAGSTFALGDNGLVVPSTQGVINPDGILVFAGPPSKRSTPRPDTGGVGRSSDPTLPDLVARRPNPRPNNLTELREIANLGGRTRDQLARLRPPARPISEQIAAQTSSDGEALSTTATALAIKTSRTPRTRPSDFANIVAKARVSPENIKEKAAVKQAAATTTTRATATGPKIPTRASVANEATQKNKIKMRKVSLIGVYGTPKKRSALVRMSNGKIVEVSIGDRVDGGKVAAIGADQVRYVKGGRNILLKMPPRG